MSEASRKRHLVRIRDLIRALFKDGPYQFNPKRPFLPLMVPSYSVDEVMEAIDSMLSTNVTMGEKVFKFEDKFAAYVGRKEAIMVNSGSSANLVAYSSLSNPMAPGGGFRKGFEGIIPAVTWSTTMFPISNCGGIPVLCDVKFDTFGLDDKGVNRAVSKDTRLVVPVHLLGNPADVVQIKASLEGTGIKVVEDSCEAHGAEIDGKKVGGFGDLSTFSFFFSHHITTIEGGVVLTDDQEYAEIARMLRAHGWIRELKGKKKYTEKYAGIDPRFLFVNTGFNLRPTEIQGAFGIHQLRKLEGFISARRSNANYLIKRLSKYEPLIEIQRERSGTRHVWFGFPVTVSEKAPFLRDDLVGFLERHGIQTRPITSGNLAEQPVSTLVENRISGKLSTSKRIMRRSFYFGNHQYLSKNALEYIVEQFETYFKKFR